MAPAAVGWGIKATTSAGPLNIRFSGAGSLNIRFSRAGSLNIRFSGAGSLNIRFSGAGSLNIRFSGAGSLNIRFSGAGSLNIRFSGAGSLNIRFSSAGSLDSCIGTGLVDHWILTFWDIDGFNVTDPRAQGGMCSTANKIIRPAREVPSLDQGPARDVVLLLGAGGRARQPGGPRCGRECHAGE